jgi:hypothetical protein
MICVRLQVPSLSVGIREGASKGLALRYSSFQALITTFLPGTPLLATCDRYVGDKGDQFGRENLEGRGIRSLADHDFIEAQFGQGSNRVECRRVQLARPLTSLHGRTARGGGF